MCCIDFGGTVRRGRARKKMKNLSLTSEPHIPRPSNSSYSTPNLPLFVKPIQVVVSHGKELKHPDSKVAITHREQTPIILKKVDKDTTTSVEEHGSCCQRTLVKLVVHKNGHSRLVIMGAVSVGILLLLGGMDDQKALAFGPEGPLVEEFWDNVRRYALYALTVSTGAIYTIFQPILELLKNPISAILVLAIFGGSIYIVSQVLSAMVGVTEFAYDYGY